MNRRRCLLATTILCTLLLLFLMSCSLEDDDTGEGDYSQMRADLIEAHVDGERRVDYVITDDGDSLRAEPPFTAKWLEKADTTYRALLYYNLKDGCAEAVSLGQVLVPSIKPLARFAEGVKTDAVHVTSVWRARNGRYLNLRLRVMTGVEEGAEQHKQVFGCVADTLMKHGDGRQTLYLRLYHDQGGQPEYYSRELFLSVPLHGVAADTLVMGVQTYDGWYSKAIY
jgi:hypothetical protein